MQSFHRIVRFENEYEVTVTLKVGGSDLEDVVARTFADPYCVDVRVHSAATACPGDEVDLPLLDQQVSHWRNI